MTDAAPSTTDGPLSPYRVVDLTTDRGWMAGKLLADLGAEVVKVEPPGGDPGRLKGRFADDSGRPEDNLSWWFQNRGKRSIVLDLERPEQADDQAVGHNDHERLLDLIAGADVVLESFAPGWLEQQGLGPEALLDRFPHLIVTSVTPWGRTGPKAGHRATDLTLSAACGSAWLNGDPDRPPVRSSAPQFWRHAGAEAAVYTLIALQHAVSTGRGQLVDVSAQLAGIRTLMNATTFPPIAGKDIHRSGPFNPFSPVPFRMVVAAADGHVTIHPAAGKVGGPGMNHLLAEAAKEVGVPDLLVDLDYVQFDFEEVLANKAGPKGSSADIFSALGDTLAAYLARHNKAELYRDALDHRLLLAPVNTVEDLRADEQLADRGYFVTVDHEDRPPVTHAGPWARLSVTPLVETGRAPRPGEHDAEYLSPPSGRGSTRQPMAARSSSPAATPAATPDEVGQVFEGLKVWDMSWVGVGPMTGRYLADHGATVVRLDHSSRPDVLRLAPPFINGSPHLNGSQFYADFNASKLSLGLDITTEAGRELVLEMAEWADVVLESFTPRALRNLDLGYDRLSEINPSLVMLSTCMQGQTGPRAEYRGFGNLMASMTGFYEVTGWPDRDPQMVFGAYTDFISQRFCASALVAALDHRRRTGEGQHIDVSQMEAGLQFLGPELLDLDVNDRVASRMGNRDLDMAPHGIYPCVPTEGNDEAWVAIAVEGDEQWSALRRLIGEPDWARHPNHDAASGRLDNADQLDEHLAAWTATKTVAEVVDLLQPEVASAPVHNQSGLYTDPQIVHRGYFVPLEHTYIGDAPYNGLQAQLSHTPGRLTKAAPCCGEDSWYVLTELLGKSEDEVTALLVDEVIEIT